MKMIRKKLMKRNLIVVLLLCGFSAFSQDRNEPPRNVVESFHSAYPQSHEPTWSHNGNEWTARFEDRDHDDGEVVAHFDHNARHTDSYVLYDNHDIPEPIMHKFHKKYAEAGDYEVTRIEHNGSHDYYRVKFHDRNGERTVYYDHNWNERKYPYHDY